MKKLVTSRETIRFSKDIRKSQYEVLEVNLKKIGSIRKEISTIFCYHGCLTWGVRTAELGVKRARIFG